MTPLEAAVHLQAALIRDGHDTDTAARHAWQAVQELWVKRPRGTCPVDPDAWEPASLNWAVFGNPYTIHHTPKGGASVASPGNDTRIGCE